eukprot:scaffold19607_cov28-Tisochrysis_lutea.AAC.1
MRTSLLLVALALAQGCAGLLAGGGGRCWRSARTSRAVGIVRLSMCAEYEEWAQPVPRPAICMDRKECSSFRRVWALIFNPRTSNEGIYSQTHMSEDGEIVQLVLSFELEEDAERYAEMLILHDMPKATPVEVDTSMLFEFCDESGHLFGLVKRNQAVIPPEANVEEFQWNPGDSEEAPPADQGSRAELDAQRKALENLFREED